MLNVLFQDTPAQENIIKLASLAVRMWKVLRYKTTAPDGISPNGIPRVLERLLLMIRDDIQQHLISATAHTLDMDPLQHPLHKTVLQQSVATWQKIINRRSSEGPCDVEGFRLKCEEIFRRRSGYTIPNSVDHRFLFNVDTQYIGQLMMDENDTTPAGMIVLPGTERRRNGFWFWIRDADFGGA
jgi:hypothetical protein